MRHLFVHTLGPEHIGCDYCKVKAEAQRYKEALERIANPKTTPDPSGWGVHILLPYEVARAIARTALNPEEE